MAQDASPSSEADYHRNKRSSFTAPVLPVWDGHSEEGEESSREASKESRGARKVGFQLEESQNSASDDDDDNDLARFAALTQSECTGTDRGLGRRPRRSRLQTVRSLHVNCDQSQTWFAEEQGLAQADIWLNAEDNLGVGAPAPRTGSSGALRDEMQISARMNAMDMVYQMSGKYSGELERRREATLHRRRRRLKTAPSALSDSSPSSVASPTSPTASIYSLGASSSGIPDTSPVIIFDWDDTLLPTWFITEVVRTHQTERGEPEGKLTCDSPYWDALVAHAQSVRAVLCAAREVARLAIVTLARRPWVLTSADWYLPDLDLESLLNELEIPIFYAREHVLRSQILLAQLEEGVDMFMIAKRNAMKKCLRSIYGQARQRIHVISVGDSPTEQEAIKDVLWSLDEDSLCKTVKLMSEPSVEHLSEELQVLSSWFYRMVTTDHDFDISMESAEEITKIATTMFSD